MKNVSIRTATLDDLDQLIELENSCFTYDLISRSRLRDYLQKKSIAVLAAEIDRIVGSAIIFFRKNSKKARLYSFAVEKNLRKKGIATLLHGDIEKLVKQRGCTAILLEVRPDNTPAIYFYQKLGYKTIGRYTDFYEDGTDALRMKKDLK